MRICFHYKPAFGTLANESGPTDLKEASDERFFRRSFNRFS